MVLNKQGKGKIDWTDFTFNPIKGLCKFGCDYCYARKMYKRFKMNPKIKLDRKTFNCKFPEKPSKIFICSTHEILGEWIPDEWIQEIIFFVGLKQSKHTFQFLSKKPKRYSDFYFPKNCWLGTTVDRQDNIDRLYWLKKYTNDNLKFVSFEPLLEKIDANLEGIDWIIIGADSNKGAKKPELEWADSLIMNATRLNIPVWVKDNYGYDVEIKRFPNGKNP